MRRKVRITISQTKQMKLMSKFLAYCPVCDQEVEVVSKAQASDLLQTSESALEHFGDRIHVIEMVNGNIWVCKQSLFKSVRNERFSGGKYDKV